MSPKSIACDTTLLSYFAHGSIFDVLRMLFAGRLYVPPTVAGEAEQATPVGQEVAAALNAGWLVRVDMSPSELAVAQQIRQVFGLDAGEAEAIVLAATRGLILVCDEKLGRAAARSLGVQVTGSMGVLYKAVETGKLTVAEADRAIERMRAARQRLPVASYIQVKQFVEANPTRAQWLKSL